MAGGRSLNWLYPEGLRYTEGMEAPSLANMFFMSDTKTVFVILFWVNLTVLCLIAAYVYHMEDERNRKILWRFTWARTMQTLAWALLILVQAKPGLSSMILGTAALFGGFYLETRSLFSFSRNPTRITRYILDTLAILGILSLLLSYIFYGKNEERILFSALYPIFSSCSPVRFP